MPDIVHQGDKYKRIIKIAEGWIRKKLGASVDKVHDDMKYCGNPAFKRIARVINEGADTIDSGYQQRIIRNYGELFLWILYKDTAYRDIAVWILWNILEDGEAFKKELKPYLKDPKDFYVNRWVQTKKDSEELREKGEIPKHGKALSELIFTPPVQEKMLKKYKSK